MWANSELGSCCWETWAKPESISLPVTLPVFSLLLFQWKHVGSWFGFPSIQTINLQKVAFRCNKKETGRVLAAAYNLEPNQKYSTIGAVVQCRNLRKGTNGKIMSKRKQMWWMRVTFLTRTFIGVLTIMICNFTFFFKRIKLHHHTIPTSPN